MVLSKLNQVTVFLSKSVPVGFRADEAHAVDSVIPDAFVGGVVEMRVHGSIIRAEHDTIGTLIIRIKIIVKFKLSKNYFEID